MTGGIAGLAAPAARQPRLRLLATVACVLHCTGSPSAQAQAQAQDSRYVHERARIYAGAFITDRNTETRLDSEAGRGTDIDWEDDLGLAPSMTVARVGGNFWTASRQRIDFSLFDLSRSSFTRIDETINFGEETFLVDSFVNSTFDTTIVKADYSFAALSRPRGYLGVNAGLYIALTRVAIADLVGTAVESEDLTAPLPVLGFRGEYRLSEKFSIQGASQWFRIETSDAGGRLRDLFVGVDYRFGRHFRLGLGYNEVSMDLTADEADGLSGRLDWGYQGWLLYLEAALGGSR